MDGLLETVYVQGMIERFVVHFSRGAQTEPEMFELRISGTSRLILAPATVGKIATGPAPVSAICGEYIGGYYLAFDMIVGELGRAISDDERDAMFARVGLRPLYAPREDVCSPLALAKILDLESELIRYLQRQPEKMRSIHSDVFEKLIAELMASFGFNVEWTGRNQATGGDVIAVSMELAPGLKTNYLIEAKRFAANRPVGIEIARTLYGAKTVEGYANALLVTTSFFTRGVLDFAHRPWDFQVRDFHGLVEWLNKYRPLEDGKLHMDGRRLAIG